MHFPGFQQFLRPIHPDQEGYLNQQGTLIEVEGRIEATAFITIEGEAKASFKCHVNRIKLHGGGKKNHSKETQSSKETTVTSDVALMNEERPF